MYEPSSVLRHARPRFQSTLVCERENDFNDDDDIDEDVNEAIRLVSARSNGLARIIVSVSDYELPTKLLETAL
jgi:hypothetical protein